MLAIGYSAALRGIEPFVVRVEVVGVPVAEPSIHIVGLADRAVQESKERVNAAIRSSGFLFPTYKVVVNLAPAGIRKEGAAHDVALALTILAMDQQLDPKRLTGFVAVGELALDGAVKAVRGVLPVAAGLRDAGFNRLVLPADNLPEAALVDGLVLHPVRTLHDAVAVVLGTSDRAIESRAARSASTAEPRFDVEDFADVRGQGRAKRAMEVAAAGGHNLLMVGAPGSGKTMLARRMPSILPSMSQREALDVTTLYSVSGMLARSPRLMTARPFRSPHHTSTANALIGGGSAPRPGEVSLAHHGVLFLDELPEFPRSVLEVLRQPLEDGFVTVSRASGSVVFPSRFMLLASLNPCPCGYHGDPLRGCSCTPHAIRKYLSRVSGPLLDRIDIHIEVPRMRIEDMLAGDRAESSAAIRARVEPARERQRTRQDGANNAAIPVRELRRHCVLEEQGQGILAAAMARLQLSARAHDRILRVARTIADLDAVQTIGAAHVAEAVGYRSLDRGRFD